MIIDNKYIFIRNLAVTCMTCNLLYHLFPFPPIVWRISFVLLCLYGVYGNFRNFKLTPVEKSILIYVCLNVIYFFGSFLWLDNPSSTFIGNVLYAMLSFLFFSFLGRRAVLTVSFFKWGTIIFTIAGIIYYKHAEFLAFASLIGGVEDLTNNAGTIFLVLLPFLFLLENKILAFLLYSLYIFFLLQSAKRGNIIAAVVPSFVFLFYLYKEARKSIWKLILFALLIVFVLNCAVDYILQDDYLLKRYEQTMEGNSSGRDVIYSKAWNTWLNSDNIFLYVFGYGFQGTIYQIGSMAHSDWLEILVDYGLLGCFFYLLIFCNFYRMIWGCKGVLKAIIVSVLFIWGLKTTYSMGFIEEQIAFLAIPFGAIFNKDITYEDS